MWGLTTNRPHNRGYGVMVGFRRMGVKGFSYKKSGT